MRQLSITVFARGWRGFGCDPYARRRIHATSPVSKSVKEKLSAVADKVNKKVGEGLATAIETGEKATEKTKKTLRTTTKHAKAKGEADQIGQKADEVGNNIRAHRPQGSGKNTKKDV